MNVISRDAGWAANGARRPGAHRIRVAKGGQICREGDAARALFRVEYGCVRLEVDDANGGRDIIGFVFDGETMCCGLKTYWASAYAVVESLVTPHWLVDRADGWTASLQHEAMSGSERLLHDIAHRMSLLNRMTASARLIWFMNWMSERTGTSSAIVDLPMARRDIADFLGLTPETVSRGLTKLQAQGRLLRRGAHSFELLSPRRQGSLPVLM